MLGFACYAGLTLQQVKELACSGDPQQQVHAKAIADSASALLRHFVGIMHLSGQGTSVCIVHLEALRSPAEMQQLLDSTFAGHNV